MVASDRSIGGFGHTWGEDQPKVQRKRRLLEGEGIRFEGNKIRREFFVDSSVPAAAAADSTTSAPKTKSKRRNMEQQPSSPTKGKKSKYFDAAAVTGETLKQEILALLQKRDQGKTC